MEEKRQHQRVRFNVQPLVRLGQMGHTGLGRLENLSFGGLMLRTDVSLKVGEVFGCEFSVVGSVLIDISAVVVGRVGDLFSARFRSGPISERLLKDEIARSLSSGKGSVLSMNTINGRRSMRVVGGLNACLSSDFMHGLTNVSVDEIDLSATRDIDTVGAELCRIAAQDYHVYIAPPPCRISAEVAALTGWRSNTDGVLRG